MHPENSQLNINVRRLENILFFTHEKTKELIIELPEKI